jgi:hypothetical protein
MIRFEAGVKYRAHSYSEYFEYYYITVAKRTAKTLTTTTGNLHRIRILNGIEYITQGSYAWAPVFHADNRED